MKQIYIRKRFKLKHTITKKTHTNDPIAMHVIKRYIDLHLWIMVVAAGFRNPFPNNKYQLIKFHMLYKPRIKHCKDNSSSIFFF